MTNREGWRSDSRFSWTMDDLMTFQTEIAKQSVKNIMKLSCTNIKKSERIGKFMAIEVLHKYSND